VKCFLVQSSEGGSFRLSQLRTDRLAPVCKFDYVLVHAGFMGSCKLNCLDSGQDERYPTIHTTMYTGIVYGPPMDIPERYRMEDVH
jgi:hypothetical protein